MSVKTAQATWTGALTTGNGHLKTQSGKIDLDYSFKARFDTGPETNPEEILGAAHAACFSMALSHMLAEAGHPPTKVHTVAHVTFDKVADGFAITKIKLVTEGTVPGIDEKTFNEHAHKAKVGCPVSKALASVPLELDVKFVK